MWISHLIIVLNIRIIVSYCYCLLSFQILLPVK